MKRQGRILLFWPLIHLMLFLIHWKKRAHIPLLSIVEPTYQAIKRKEIQKCGMAGYRLYDGTALLQKRFIENGIHVTVPNNEERKLIDNVIAKELEFGIVNIDSKKTIDDIIQRLISEDNIEAIIMGCTELPLMYSNEKFPVPVFDTLKYHIQGIIEFMFKFR